MDVIESKSLDRDAGETRFPLFLIALWTMIASREIAHRLDLFVLPHVPRLRRLGSRHFRSHNHHQTTLYYEAV
jgi:hypothetical protein